MSIDIVEALPGMELGRGYDLLREDPKILKAVKGKLGVLPQAKGQVTAEYNYSVVNSLDEFQQALGIDASVSVNAGLMGGSAKSSFEKKCKVTSEATYCLVSFKAINAPTSLRGDVRLHEDAMELLEIKDMERFRERYGTHFCSDIYTGVEFIGSIRIEADTSEEEEAISASINAKYGPAKGSASFSLDTSEKTSTHSIEIFTYQSGGIMQPVQTLGELFETGKRVAEQGSKGLGTPTQIVLGSYDELELPLDGVSAFAQQHVQREMRRLKKLYNQLRQDRNNIDYVLANSEKYVRYNKKKFMQLNEIITKSLKTIIDLSDQCARNFDEYRPVEPEIPAVELPERKRRRSRRKSKARLKKANFRLRARNKEMRARVLEDKAEDLVRGARKTRLKKEVAELRRDANVLRKKIRKINKKIQLRKTKVQVKKKAKPKKTAVKKKLTANNKRARRKVPKKSG